MSQSRHAAFTGAMVVASLSHWEVPVKTIAVHKAPVKLRAPLSIMVWGPFATAVLPCREDPGVLESVPFVDELLLQFFDSAWFLRSHLCLASVVFREVAPRLS